MTGERPYETEVCYRGRSVFEAGYHDNRKEAEKVAAESLNLDESVYGVRLPDHGGRVLDAFKREGR